MSTTIIAITNIHFLYNTCKTSQWEKYILFREFDFYYNKWFPSYFSNLIFCGAFLENW